MSFVPGNKRTIYLGTQDDKDTPQDTPTAAFRVEDFTPGQVRQLIRLAETDRTTQRPRNVVVGYTPGFTFKTYLRPSQAGILLASLLGADVDTGTTPHYIHTITPDVDTPYLTVFEEEPDVLVNEYDGVRCTSIQFDGATGGALEATVICEALGFVAGGDAPDLAAALDLPFVYPEVAIARATVHAGNKSQFTITVARNGQRAQGDNGFSSIDYINGLFSVDGSFTQYMDSDADQRQVDTGSKTGTVPTTAIYEEALSIKATRDANTSIEFQMPAVSYTAETRAVAVDGSPLAEVLTFETDQQATLAANLVVVVKDAQATPNG